MDTFTIRSIEAIFKGKFSTADTVKLLWKGGDSFRSIFDALREAGESICLEFYIFRNDETGGELAEILKQKAREGVQVYLLYDHFGSFGTPRKFWKDLEEAGISIRASYPFHWTAPFHYVRRDHRKLIIIDRTRAFTGGLNIANEYSGFLRKHFTGRGAGWRDTGIMLQGPVTGELFKAFRKSWYARGGDVIDDRAALRSPADGSPTAGRGLPALPIFASSAKGRRKMRRLLYYSINHARESITLTTAYFTPSRRMVETLENAVARGVRVRLLVPGVSDVPAASYAGRAFFARLLRAGVGIYTYNGEILHAKTYVFDNCWSIIGSANLDFLSLRYNDEGNIGILDAEFAVKMNDIFEDDKKNSSTINPELWRRRPLADKLKEHFFSLFRRRL